MMNFTARKISSGFGAAERNRLEHALDLGLHAEDRVSTKPGAIAPVRMP
jgi:hypothetical protein